MAAVNLGENIVNNYLCTWYFSTEMANIKHNFSNL